MGHWEEIKPENSTNVWKPVKAGEIFEGFYQSKKEGVGANASNIYLFTNLEGEEISIWGTTVLDTRFKNLVEREKVRIEYLGKEKNAKGVGYHNYKVEHWLEGDAKENVNPDDVPF